MNMRKNLLLPLILLSCLMCHLVIAESKTAPTKKDDYGLTPLHRAVVKGDIELVKSLLEKGAEVDSTDNAGRTPLHYAAGASFGSANPQVRTVDMVQCLLDNRANVNVQDNIGWTPLHYAAFTRNRTLVSLPIVSLLIDREANPSLVDIRGYTPYSLVEETIQFWLRYVSSTDAPEEKRNSFEAVWELINNYKTILDLLQRASRVYYVATNGIDAGPGTLEHPLKDIAAVLDIVEPGDVIIVRGGTYHCLRTINFDRSGEQGNPIYLRSYPGEMPILDFSGARGSAFLITGAYWHLKGFTIREGNNWGICVRGARAHHNILENMTTSGNGLSGIWITDDAGYNIVLNCDSRENFDLKSNGEDAEGFEISFWVDDGNVLIGNRAWNNSDDGYDFWRAGSVIRLERCYSWRNGENIWFHPFFSGNGNGFKLGRGKGQHILINCFAWGHTSGAGAGFTLNGNASGPILRNCSAWGNRRNYEFASDYWESIGGAQEDCVFVNNLSFAGRRKDTIDDEAESQHNSWDSKLNLTLTENDFLSLDDSKMTAPRNPDGSIPENDFLKLSPNSKAIDKGVDIGMPYVGKAPDLGAFEFDPKENAENYVKMLHQYVRDHDINKINEMLESGIDVNEKDWLGYTPVHWACYFGYADLVTLLIDKGANPDLISDTGRTCLEIATAMDYKEIAELLKKHGAQ